MARREVWWCIPKHKLHTISCEDRVTGWMTWVMVFRILNLASLEQQQQRPKSKWESNSVTGDYADQRCVVSSMILFRSTERRIRSWIFGTESGSMRIQEVIQKTFDLRVTCDQVAGQNRESLSRHDDQKWVMIWVKMLWIVSVIPLQRVVVWNKYETRPIGCDASDWHHWSERRCPHNIELLYVLPDQRPDIFEVQWRALF